MLSTPGPLQTLFKHWGATIIRPNPSQNPSRNPSQIPGRRSLRKYVYVPTCTYQLRQTRDHVRLTPIHGQRDSDGPAPSESRRAVRVRPTARRAVQVCPTARRAVRVCPSAPSARRPARGPRSERCLRRLDPPPKKIIQIKNTKPPPKSKDPQSRRGPPAVLDSRLGRAIAADLQGVVVVLALLLSLSPFLLPA